MNREPPSGLIRLGGVAILVAFVIHIVVNMVIKRFPPESPTMGGFSMAAWITATLPKWLAALGFTSAIGSLACGVFVVSILTGGWAEILIEAVPPGGLAWFLITGVVLASTRNNVLAKGSS